LTKGARSLAALAVAALLTSGCGGHSDTSSDGNSAGSSSGNPDTFVEDDFSDAASGWAKDDDDSVQLAYTDGGYRVLMKAPGPRDARLEFGSDEAPVGVQAVSVEADATERAGPYTTRGTDEFEFHGVACWGASAESDRLELAYKFVLTPEGHYGILKDQSDQLLILAEGDGDFGGYGATRRIRGECVAGGDGATSLALYVDDKRIAKASDPDGPDRFPAIGLTVETSEAGTDVFFDNVLARNPRAPRPSSVGPTTDPFSESQAGADSAALPSEVCKKAGIRYSGRAAEGGEVCFTLTRDRKTLLEVGYTFVPEHGCPEMASGTVYAEGGGGPALTGNQVRSSGFTGTIRGADASGVLQDWDICKERTFLWRARRVP
jgi:hypothetical protein